MLRRAVKRRMNCDLCLYASAIGPLFLCLAASHVCLSRELHLPHRRVLPFWWIWAVQCKVDIRCLRIGYTHRNVIMRCVFFFSTLVVLVSFFAQGWVGARRGPPSGQGRGLPARQKTWDALLSLFFLFFNFFYIRP